MASFYTLDVTTSRGIEFQDITPLIRQYLSDNGVRDGVLLVYTPHTTAGITVNENADPAVRTDLMEFIRRKVPHESYFKHLEGNSPAHILSSVIGASESFIVENGEPVLGTWQGIFFCEFDGPRRRKVYLKWIGTSGV
jgi:secondary thiamine-phosphate synthase enzyme